MEIMKTLGDLANVAGVTGAIVSAIGVVRLQMDKWKMSDKVSVHLCIDEEGTPQVRLPIYMRRRDVSRAEILGRLGMLPMATPGKRFTFKYLSTPEFDEAVNAVAEGKRNLILLHSTREEADQFDSNSFEWSRPSSAVSTSAGTPPIAVSADSASGRP